MSSQTTQRTLSMFMQISNMRAAKYLARPRQFSPYGRRTESRIVSSSTREPSVRVGDSNFRGVRERGGKTIALSNYDPEYDQLRKESGPGRTEWDLSRIYSRFNTREILLKSCSANTIKRVLERERLFSRVSSGLLRSHSYLKRPFFRSQIFLCYFKFIELS